MSKQSKINPCHSDYFFVKFLFLKSSDPYTKQQQNVRLNGYENDQPSIKTIIMTK